MKRIIVVCMIKITLLGVFYGVLQAASLDGTSNFKYQNTHYLLRDTNTVTGIVRFANGFSILPATNHASSATLDTCISCSGGFDLGSTSTLKLAGDLILDTATTLTSGGKIYGYNRALILSGDLTLAANQILHLGGNLIVDGQGHDIFINEHAQIMLDNYATVTIKNATIHNKRNAPGWPSLAITTSLSRLTLSDVELALDSDLYINKGQLFIHDDVAVTGTSSFVWRSCGPCTIEPNSCFYFDHGTTFSYAPSTTSMDLIRMTDKSSMMQFSGSSLLATHTGLRLTKGRLYLDDKIMINGLSNNIINSVNSSAITVDTSGNPRFVAWSPDDRYLAVAGSASDVLQVFAFAGGALTQVGVDVATGSVPCSVAWSPDGKYIAVANYLGQTFQVFAFSGSTPTQVGATVTVGRYPWDISWSPDGKYIAVGCGVDHLLKVFVFTGKTPFLVASNSTTVTFPRSIGWSPDGKYIAVANYTSPAGSLQIFSFTGSALSQVGSDASTGEYATSVSWSPDGKHLAVANSEGDTLQIFAFAGSTPSLEGSASTGEKPRMAVWSPDGKYISVTRDNTPGQLMVYAFTGGDPTQVGGTITTGDQPSTCFWSSDGKYIAVVNYASASLQLQVFFVNYRPDTSVPTLSNCITFGNSALGAAYNLDVCLLSGANVEINGKVFDNSAA